MATNNIEQAVLTFTMTGSNKFQLTASFTPAPKNMQEVVCDTHQHALAIVHIFNDKPVLMMEVANYLANGGNADDLSKFLGGKNEKN